MRPVFGRLARLTPVRPLLRPLYDEDDFAGFESFGGYIGYRTGIYDDGDWSLFAAGD